MTDVMIAVCRGCGAELHHTFVNLGVSPLANSYVKASELNQAERFYPLHAMVCAQCFLVQLEAQATAGRDLHRLRIFFLLFGQLVRTR